VVDAEQGTAIAADATGYTVQVAERDYVPVLIVERGPLTAGETFVAAFENGPVADRALGVKEVLGTGRNSAPAESAPGKDGKGVAVGAGLAVPAWLNVSDASGSIVFDALVADKAKGQVLMVGSLCEVVIRQDPADKKAMQLALQLSKDAKDKEPVTAVLPAPTAGWHRFALIWKDGRMTLSVDGGAGQGLPLQQPLGLAVRAKMVQFGNDPGQCGQVQFGPRGTAITAIDNLRLAR
jgi:hypothetical protein